ncbi:type III secretion system inner membrane ring lipoprotein SctJ [Caballeronia sp. EK]|uniref:type III secretion system inner membrane ring lipoprotein SctJ n=1 Tax=Caballeronia sp. EK TaxID=2767469 RepID=UPI001CA3DE6F|nr:type III secretion inner membrane ring lipoprotein SctJ [Caballeronia sp. EK]
MLLWALLVLGGCKSELYSNLDEADANQMLALLIYNKIPASKTASKEGVGLSVDSDRFVDAVEVLRQHGLPQRKTATIQDLFPSGQLVSSPEQEEAKLNYLKSQQIEKMLSSIDGVIVADVAVARRSLRDDETTEPASAAVFIKYSPDVNFTMREAEIRALVRNGIPGLDPGRISLTMQRADYRYMTPAKMPEATSGSMSRLLIVGAGGVLLLLLIVTVIWRLWNRKGISA